MDVFRHREERICNIKRSFLAYTEAGWLALVPRVLMIYSESVTSRRVIKPKFT